VNDFECICHSEAHSWAEESIHFMFPGFFATLRMTDPFLFINYILMKHELDDVQKALILFFKKNTNGEWLTLREIAAEIGVKHPQTVLNKLNQLVLKWYFVKDERWYRLVRESITDKYTDIVQLPIFGFAQCGNQWKAVINEYTQERIPVTMAFIGMQDLENCFFVRAKWNSMEPKIQDW